MLSGETSTVKSEGRPLAVKTSHAQAGEQKARVIRFPEEILAKGSVRTPAAITSVASQVFGFDGQKRAFDLLVSTTLLLTLSPVILAVAVLVRLTSSGPVIFRQKRLTRNGKIFTMYKFRTMRVDAENGSGAVWATNSDPRVTPIGAFLRRTRLDELPQLINVLSGDMSMIGPRPERPEFTKELSELLPNFHRRLEVKGGITGLAQVSSGYAACIESYRKKLAFDLLYVKKRSLLLDLKIADKTIAVIITGTGAR